MEDLAIKNQGNLIDIDKLVDAITNDPLLIQSVDFAKVTHNYALEVIEELFNCVGIADVDRLAGIIDTQWRLDVSHHHVGVTTFSAIQRKWIPVMPDFPERLADLRDEFFKRDELLKEQQRKFDEWKSSHHVTTTEPAEMVTVEATPPPSFIPAEETEQPQYHLADLPHNLQQLFTFDDDVTYSLLIVTMRNDVWPVLKDNKGIYADVIRFICNKRGITGKDTSRKDFDLLVPYFFPEQKGSLMSSMKRRNDTNLESSYRHYDSIPKYQYNIKELVKEDGPVIEELLQPVIDRIHELQNGSSVNPA